VAAVCIFVMSIEVELHCLGYLILKIYVTSCQTDSQSIYIVLCVASEQGRSQDFISTEAKGWTGGLGAEPPAGTRSRAPGQGWSPSEAESFSV